MHYHKLAAGISMRMRVPVRRTAVGSPAGMADTCGAFRFVAFNLNPQVRQAAYAFFNSNLTLVIHCDTGGIIAAVFQFAHAIQ